MNSICKLVASMKLIPASPITYGVRCMNIRYIDRPKPGKGNYKFMVHYPEDGKYTIKPLKMTYLGGRDPKTGRIIVGTLGGGIKHKYRWVDYFRNGPKDGTFLEERILAIEDDPNRTAKIALVGCKDKLRYIIATENMKPGDIIKTSSFIPKMAVAPTKGDAYPVGALPVGTQICCVEKFPGEGIKIARAAGTSAVIRAKTSSSVTVFLPQKITVFLDPHCMATVGRVSNVDHYKEHIGSPNRMRLLGHRPRSGLWQRKDGYKGRKIYPQPPTRPFTKKVPPIPWTKLTLPSEEPTRRVIPCTDRVS